MVEIKTKGIFVKEAGVKPEDMRFGHIYKAVGIGKYCVGEQVILIRGQDEILFLHGNNITYSMLLEDGAIKDYILTDITNKVKIEFSV